LKILVLGYLCNIRHSNIHWQFSSSKIDPQDVTKIRQPSKTTSTDKTERPVLIFGFHNSV